MKCKLLLFLVVLLLTGTSYAKGWNGIVPLKSTRSDVRRILGKAAEETSKKAEYKLPKAYVTINYAPAECRLWTGVWDVADGTVLSIEVVPRGLVFVSSVVNLASFTKGPGDYDLPGNYIWWDEVNGMSIVTDVDPDTKRDMVMTLFYFPTAVERQQRCKV